MNDASLLEDLLRHKLAIIDRKLEELEAVGEGERKIVSICMAYVKRVEIENAKLNDRIDSMMDTMVQHRTDIDSMDERLATSSVWATKINKWAKEQGMT